MQDNAQFTADAIASGFQQDSPENLAALPRTPAAQAKLRARGIRAPTHGHGHPDWIEEAKEGVARIKTQLHDDNLVPGSEDYHRALKIKLEELLKQLREEMLKKENLTEGNDNGPNAFA
jgi:hypothetical protein